MFLIDSRYYITRYKKKAKFQCLISAYKNIVVLLYRIPFFGMWIKKHSETFRLRPLVFLCVFIGIQFRVFGQIQADFTYSQSEGCVPLIGVEFTNTSTGAYSSAQWIFEKGGIGSDSITVLNYPTQTDPVHTNPVFSYPFSGEYGVTLIVSDGVDSDTLQLDSIINVYARPQISYAIREDSMCFPQALVIDNNSSSDNSSQMSFVWSFGDGNTSINTDVEHSYSAVGAYTVFLSATDSLGCQSDSLANVWVFEKPVIDFTSNITVSCELPAQVDFLVNSSNVFLSDFIWSFGNGDSAFSATPTESYQQNGVYDVVLIAAAESGCRDTVEKLQYIQVGEINIQATLNKDTFCRSDDLTFAAQADDATDYLWQFDGFNTNAQSGSFTLPKTFSGWSTYTLHVTSIGSCVDSIIDSFYVDRIVPDFIAVTDTFFCNAPAEILLQNTSEITSPYDSVLWQVGSQNFSDLDSLEYILPNAGYYDASLIVFSSGGCVASRIKDSLFFVFDAEPKITSISQSEGCSPIFTSISFDPSTDAYGSDISLYTFDLYGDGSLEGINSNPLLSVLDTFGLVYAYLDVQYTNGCVKRDSLSIAVGDKPNAFFEPVFDTICANQVFSFTDQSTFSQTPIDTWLWSFSDGSSDTTQNPAVQFLDTGYISTLLVVESFGCIDSIRIDSSAYINGPVLDVLVLTPDCDRPLDLVASLEEKGATQWYWVLDNEQNPIDSNTTNFSYTFDSSGVYTGRVIAQNNLVGCSYEQEFTFLAYDHPATISVVLDTFCAQTPVLFSVDEPDTLVSYSWDLGDGTPLLDSSAFTYMYASPGGYQIQLFVDYPNSCKDTLLKTIYMGELEVQFDIDTTEGCAPLSVTFTDQSQSEFGIASWQWITQGILQSFSQNYTHVYTTQGVHAVTLKVTDSIGCTQSIQSSQVIKSYKPTASFMADSFACIGSEFTFTNTSNEAIPFPNVYLWHFGDGSLSTQENPTHIYDSLGVYTITLISTNVEKGCSDTLVDSLYLKVEDYPVANFTADPTSIGCASTPSVFTDQSTSNDSLYAWFWDFGDFNTDTLQNPEHVYLIPGGYDVQLVVSTQGGCSDTLLKPQYISVDGPFLSYGLSKDSICKGDEVFFQIDSASQLLQYSIDYGDGTPIDTIFNIAPQTFSHTYEQNGGITPIFTLWSDTSVENECKVSIPNQLYIHQVIADFSVTDSFVCVYNPQIVFENTSLGADSIFWDLGDGTIFSDSNSFTHAFLPLDSTYQASMHVVNFQYGCKDSIFQSITVSNLLNADLIKDTFLCQGDTLDYWYAFDSSDSVVWASSAAYFQTFNDTMLQGFNPSNFEVNLFLEDTSGCMTYDTAFVEIIGGYDLSYNNHTDQQFYALSQEPFTPQLTMTPSSNAYIFNWAPSVGLSCTDCLNPQINMSNDQVYTLSVTDLLGCNAQTYGIELTVIPEPTLEMPTAFSPNADGINDTAFVRGLGVTDLLEYKIFNRWGELVYENTGDISNGWDGRYKDKIQAFDSYAYVIKARVFTGEILEKKGYINLIR